MLSADARQRVVVRDQGWLAQRDLLDRVQQSVPGGDVGLLAPLVPAGDNEVGAGVPAESLGELAHDGEFGRIRRPSYRAGAGSQVLGGQGPLARFRQNIGNDLGKFWFGWLLPGEPASHPRRRG